MLTLGAAPDPAKSTVDVFNAAKPKIADPLANIPPAAQMLLPGAVVLLVDRHRHPVMWWLFGVIPLTGAGARALINRKFL